jgi:predicted Zn-dependent protease
MNGPITCQANVLIVYDPCGPDWDHAQRIATDIPALALCIAYAGHPVGSFLSETGLLERLVLEAIDGRYDIVALARRCRNVRRGSSHYLSALADAQPRSRNATAIALARRAVAASPGSPSALHFLALQLRADGRIDEALTTYEACVALEPKPPFLFMQARMLLEAGHAKAALAVAERLIDQGAVLADAHYLAFRALILLDRPKDATSELRAALRADPSNIVYWKALPRAARAHMSRLWRRSASNSSL